MSSSAPQELKTTATAGWCGASRQTSETAGEALGLCKTLGDLAGGPSGGWYPHPTGMHHLLGQQVSLLFFIPLNLPAHLLIIFRFCIFKKFRERPAGVSSHGADQGFLTSTHRATKTPKLISKTQDLTLLNQLLPSSDTWVIYSWNVHILSPYCVPWPERKIWVRQILAPYGVRP